MKIIKKNDFIGNILKVASGTAFAQVFAIVLSPLLTRTYSPENFGVLALFTSTTTIISIVSCFSYEVSIVLAENDEEAASLLGASLIFVLFTSILSFLLLPFLIKFQLFGVAKTNSLSLFLLIPPMVLFSGLYLALSYWNSRLKKFAQLSISKVIQSVTTVSTQLIAGILVNASSLTLVGGVVIGSITSSIILGFQTWREHNNILKSGVSIQKFLLGVRKHYKLPIYNIPSVLLNSVSLQLPVILLSLFFSTAITGYYSLAYRVLSLPMSLIGSSVGQVFFQKASDANTNENLNEIVEDAFSLLLKISAFPLLTLALVSPSLFLIAFGQEWQESSYYFRILLPWCFVWFLSSPLSQLYFIANKQKELFYIQLTIFVSRLLSISIGGFFEDPRLSLILFSFSGCIVYGFYGGYAIVFSGARLNSLFMSMFKSLKTFTAFSFLLFIGWATIENPAVELVYSFFVLVGYFLISYDTMVYRLLARNK